MKKQTKLFFLLIIVLSFASCFEKATESEARIILEKHLEQRYGEPFYVGRMGRRSSRNDREWFEANILPLRHMNTPKERDRYYWSTGTARIVRKWYGEDLSPGDIYMAVRLNEDANDYFRPKLKEIFGDMVLPVLDINVHIVKGNGNFLETVEFASREGTTREQKGQGEGAGFDITGGIYIWGRIDDLEEKEVYREKIFEFIQYMISQNMFTYVDLAFYILDERSLAPRFDKEIGPELVRAREKIETADEFIAYRSELLSELDDEYLKLTEEEIYLKMNSFNMGYFRDFYSSDKNGYSVIRQTHVFSPNFWESRKLVQHIKKLYYDSKDEILLFNSVKLYYREYDKEKFDNNEWEG